MAQLTIVTTPQNSGDGTPLATAFNYCNSNFSELYSRVQVTPPATLVGVIGDTAGMYAYDSTYFYYCYANYDGSSTIWGQVTQIGNVSISSLNNGTSNVNIGTANGNVSFSVNGTANVGVISDTGLTVTGNIAGNFILGNGSQLTGLPALYGNANVAAYLPIYSGNLESLNGPVTTTGNVSGVALLTEGFVSATGNISGSYFFGNGAFLTGITASGTGGNANSIQNGITIVDIPVSAGNVAVTVGFSSNVMVITAEGVDVTGNITAESVSLTQAINADGNVAGGNLLTTGLISASGNITGAYIIGDGSFLTNVGGGGSYGNADVAAYLPTYTGNLAGGNLSVTDQANVTGNLNVNYQSRINGTVKGQLNGLVNGVNTAYGTWDFGFLAANTYANPVQWIFAQTSAGNVDMGTVIAPTPLNIDIGTIF